MSSENLTYTSISDFGGEPQNGKGKWLVIGRGQGDRFLEVVYLVDPDDTLFIIHAMPLTTRRRRG